MARNEEKHVTRLNRLLLQQQREEDLKKNPPRPKLYTLNSADEIKKWLPSLKKDIDFYLKQSQVSCYPERKISEFAQEIEKLKREYQAFVRKLREFDPSLGAVPWTERGYLTRKRPCPDSCADEASDKPNAKLQELDPPSTSQTETNPVTSWCDSPVEREASVPNSDFKPLSTPLLAQEARYTVMYGYSDDKPEVPWNVNTELEDKPLNFCMKPETSKVGDNKTDMDHVESRNQSSTGALVHSRCAFQTDTQDEKELYTASHGAQCTPAKNSLNLSGSQHGNVSYSNNSYVTATSKDSLQSLIDTYTDDDDDDDGPNLPTCIS